MKIANILEHLKKRYVLYVLLIIILYFSFSEILWLNKDNYPTAWDDSWNLLASNYYYQTLIGAEHRSPAEFGNSFPAFWPAIRAYPPLFRLSSVPLYLIFGFSPDIGIATNIFFYLILILCTFSLTKKLANKNAALFSCFLVSTMPLLAGLARVYLLDFALTAIVLLSILLLFKTESFTNRKYSLLFAIFFGLGLLVKLQHLIFVLPVTLFLIAISIKRKNWSTKQTKNIILVLIISILIFSPWALNNLENISNYVINASSKAGAIEGDPSWNSIQGLFYYIISTINGISFFYSLLFALSLITIMYGLSKNKQEITNNKDVLFALFFFIISSIIIFTYIANKDHRFIAPIIPVIAILTSVGLWKIKISKKIAVALMAIIIILGLIQLNGYTSGYKVLGKNIYWNGVYISTNYNQYLVPASDENWKIKEALSIINEELIKSKENNSRICICSDIKPFNPMNFQMYAYAYNINPKLINICPSNYTLYNYIITKTGDLRLEPLPITRDKITKDQDYILLAEFQLPENNTAKVYKRIK